jgi:hypothetical protein
VKPDAWLCSALDRAGLGAFKLLTCEQVGSAMRVRVLHKDTGVVWEFDCRDGELRSKERT